jgi:hypothetical protein
MSCLDLLEASKLTLCFFTLVAQSFSKLDLRTILPIFMVFLISCMIGTLLSMDGYTLVALPQYAQLGHGIENMM